MEVREKVSNEDLQAYLKTLVEKSKVAQKQFERDYTKQRPIDEVVRAIGKAVCDNGKTLGEEAFAETGMGNVESKIAKLTNVALLQWVQMRGKNSVEYEDCPGEPGVKYLPKPMGVIGAVMPSTNPIATIIGNAMMALKCRNSIIILPHPASVKVSMKTVDIMRAALEEIGAPADLVQCIDGEYASIEATMQTLSMCDCNVATGGAAMVKSVYSVGKPAFGVGQGNCQEIIDRGMTDEEYERLVKLAIMNRTVDNGVPCGGEQTAHVPEELLDKYLGFMQKNGCFLVDNDDDIAKLRDAIFPGGGTSINRKVVGKQPHEVGVMAGIEVPEDTKILLVKNQAWGTRDVLCREILFPIIRYTTYQKFEDAVDRAIENLEVEGKGHSSCIWSHDQEHIEYTAKRIPVGRFHINQPTAGYNNGVSKTITICYDCGMCWEYCDQGAITMEPLPEGRTLQYPLPDTMERAEEILAICRKAHLLPMQIICKCGPTNTEEIVNAILDGARDMTDLTLKSGTRAGCTMYCVGQISRLFEACGRPLESREDDNYHPITQTLWDFSDEALDFDPIFKMREMQTTLYSDEVFNAAADAYRKVVKERSEKKNG